MKKYTKILFTLFALLSIFTLSSCGASKKTAEKNVLKIGATPVPHAEILNYVKPILEKDGITLQIIEFNDYIKPNEALYDEEILANFFQHTPYMNSFAKDKGYDLVSAGSIHVEPLGVYSKNITDIKDIPDGAAVTLPNDPTNHGRALILLHNNGIITLKDPTNLSSYYKNDIAENPHNLEFTEIEAAMLPRTLNDVALAVINTNYALDADLNPTEDALLIEGKESPYANIITVLEKNKNNEMIKKLTETLQSDEIKKFIEEKYKGAIIPAF
ncbi:MetQ/NlpA family ABC transporter substrate-binding protein [Oceanirhabdus sp. W0125-5]|uniref:MetQ/NlpA family ABC transporter substrate-binding protein n=1 Tax=Oceanirhabdus sp. W0125-5 TaxID=2999116 RepID=UPI0022F33FEA|nr:MetQ/NlpA family ABC transporter substrate-binding protein [Oceanirhabdus sp. W0125-5]WBW99651.1 MetQ/NlpA family ABC transporter substrate-binding protein [Oceanirhabdus sp. W0125-5]